MKKLMMMRCTRVVDAKEPASLLVVAIFEVVVREEDIEMSAGSLSNRSVATNRRRCVSGCVLLEMKVKKLKVGIRRIMDGGHI